MWQNVGGGLRLESNPPPTPPLQSEGVMRDYNSSLPATLAARRSQEYLVEWGKQGQT